VEDSDISSISVTLIGIILPPYPPHHIVAWRAISRQQLGKHVPTTTDRHATIEVLLETGFYGGPCRGFIRKTTGATAMIGSYRLSCNEQWKPKFEGFGHAHMARDMEKEPILQMGSDKIIPRHVYVKPFTIRFPDTSE
jgi:hypothetical protein